MKSSVEVITDMMPSVRAEMAREMDSSYRLNQMEISNFLGVTQAAVSQYLRQLRGKNRNIFNQETSSQIKLLCENIINGKIGKQQMDDEIYAICKYALKNK
jgi:predicted transcriptional regulator